MKVLFRNTTKYTKENRNNFSKFHNDKFGRRDLFKLIIYIILIVYMVIFNIICKNWILFIIALIVGIIIYWYNDAKKAKRKKQGIKKFTFYFYDRYIKVKCRNKMDRINYWELKKIYETDENFFLYLDEKKSIILDKEGFEIGTKEEFSDFIKHKCLLKYKNEMK